MENIELDIQTPEEGHTTVVMVRTQNSRTIYSAATWDENITDEGFHTRVLNMVYERSEEDTHGDN